MYNTSVDDLGPPDSTLEDKLYIIYTGVAVVVGTSMNLYALSRLRGLHAAGRRSGMLTFSIAIVCGNLTVFVFDALVSAIWRHTFRWYAGDFLCRVLAVLRPFGAHLTSNLVVAVAIDMCLAVYKPLVPRKHRVRVFIYVAVAIALLLSMPQLAFWRTATPFVEIDPNWAQCAFIPPVNQSRISNRTMFMIKQIYNTYHLLTIFWIPFIVLLPAYGAMLFQILRRTPHQSQGSGDPLLRRHQPASSSHFRGITQAVRVVGLYLLSWLPYQILSIVVTVNPNAEIHAYLTWLYSIRLLNNIINLTVYAFPVCRLEQSRRNHSSSINARRRSTVFRDASPAPARNKGDSARLTDSTGTMDMEVRKILTCATEQTRQ